MQRWVRCVVVASLALDASEKRPCLSLESLGLDDSEKRACLSLAFLVPYASERGGRLRDTPAQKPTMIEAYQASALSALSALRFATLQGVNDQTLVSWIRRAKWR